ncbi:MAG: metallophosphoesterase [Deltaproteobacteria bacterium]|nr:metallophosphoesterase [Deltaproteobacteria bacterium]
MFRLAQVSDPHFRSFRPASLRQLLGKRAIGALNLLLRRRFKHRMELLQALLVDVRGRPLDHLALTGDLCNVALASEWNAALRWIEATGLSPEQVTVIPGNHDAYVPEVIEQGTFERLFAAYLTADLRAGAETYPFARFRGDVALVCASTAVPTGDLGAWGRMGEAQLARLESLLMMPEVKARCRLLLIHHPPQVNRHGEQLNLKDREALQDVLSRAGADLVMHGHDHRDFFKELPGPGRSRIPVVGVGSASYAGGPDRRARYHIYEIEGSSITVATYVHDPATRRFVEYRRKQVAA